MGYDQYDCKEQFPLALANICPWPLVPFFQDCLSGFSRPLFPTIFLKTALYGGRQLLVWRKTVTHINKSENSGRHQRGLISPSMTTVPLTKKFASHNSMQKKEDRVGHKTVNKKERQSKKTERKRKIEIDSEKKIKFRLVGMREKQKSSVFIYVRVVGKYAFFVAFLC